MVPVLLDMETRDPDDVLGLCLVASHPALRLVAVTVNPGTREQIGVVRALLARLGVEVPVGARVGQDTGAVSPFHHEWLGPVPPGGTRRGRPRVAVFDPGSFTWAAAEVFREQGRWGAHPGPAATRSSPWRSTASARWRRCCVRAPA